MLQTSLFFHFRAKHPHLIYKQPSTGLEIKAKMDTHWSTTDLKTITGQGEISSFSNVSFEHISGDSVNGIMKSARQIVALRMRSYGTGRIFDRLKNLTVHFVHTEPFNIFVLFARNFIIVWLKCFHVNGTPKRTNPVSRIFFVRKWGGKSLGNRFAKRTNFQLVENSFSAV